MSNCKFKVGDYVITKVDLPFGLPKGIVGKVIAVNSILGDEVVSFYALGRRLNMNTKYVDRYIKDQPNKIVITTDGCTTTAKMYRDKQLVEVQTTKCHPDDRFDFKVGARVAFDRLMGEKKEEPVKRKIRVGDVVKIVNDGYQYTTYIDWVNAHIENERDRYLFDFSNHVNTQHTFKIKAIHKHTVDCNRTLAYIQDEESRRCYVINIEGLERVS